MSVKTKIRKHGGAAIMTIPVAALRMAKLNIGEEVSLLIEDGRLIVKPIHRRSRLTMAELLKGSGAIKRLTAETSWAREGRAIGHEID